MPTKAQLEAELALTKEQLDQMRADRDALNQELYETKGELARVLEAVDELHETNLELGLLSTNLEGQIKVYKSMLGKPTMSLTINTDGGNATVG